MVNFMDVPLIISLSNVFLAYILFIWYVSQKKKMKTNFFFIKKCCSFESSVKEVKVSMVPTEGRSGATSLIVPVRTSGSITNTHLLIT